MSVIFYIVLMYRITMQKAKYDCGITPQSFFAYFTDVKCIVALRMRRNILLLS